MEGADGNPKLASEAGQEDKQVIGNGLPSMYAGLNTTLLYKKFDNQSKIILHQTTEQVNTKKDEKRAEVVLNTRCRF